MVWHPAHTHLCLQTCLHETLASVALQQQPAPAYLLPDEQGGDAKGCLIFQGHVFIHTCIC